VLAAAVSASAPPTVLKTSPELQLVEQARICLRAGDTKRASALAESAVHAARADIGKFLAVHRAAQDVLIAAGKTDRLVVIYDKLYNENVADPRRRYLRARVEPDPDRRRNDLEAALARSPDLFWAAYDLAELYASRGEWSRAARKAERAVRIRPGEAAAWNVLGHLRIEASRFLGDAIDRKALAERAREALVKAIKLDPALAEARYNLGLVARALGDSESAKASWREAVRLRPDFVEALLALGHLAAREGDLEEAISFYKKALAARGDYGAAHNNLAVVYYRRKAYALATKHLALAEATGHVPAESFKRALVRATEEQAFEEFRKLVETVKPGSIRLHRVGVKRAVAVRERDRRVLIAALQGLAFRDSHGGVRLGARKVRGTFVARYAEAARVEVTLAGGEKRTLLVVSRESARTGTKTLVTWVVDSGYRFSATAPDLVRTVARVARLEVTLPEDD
jgi:tetratricopeptide (TPR) repeat protein